MVETPTLDKMLEVKEASHQIGQFLEWLQEEGYVLGKYIDGSDYDPYLVPTYEPIEKLLAKYFDIDLDATEKEKRLILEQLRSSEND